MKKMISVFLLLVMALSLASCGKSDTNADTNGGASTTVAEAQQGSSTSEQNESKLFLWAISPHRILMVMLFPRIFLQITI